MSRGPFHSRVLSSVLSGSQKLLLTGRVMFDQGGLPAFISWVLSAYISILVDALAMPSPRLVTFGDRNWP